MKSEIIRRGLAAMMAAAMGAAAAPGIASGYPDKPITLVFPWSTGSGIDAVTRVFAQKLGDELGQPVIVLSKPGSASTIGATYVQRAAPDGYTLLIGDGGTFAVTNSLRQTPVFDAVNDFTPVSLLVKTPYFVLTNAGSSVSSLGDFVSRAKAEPGSIAYGNVGVGSLAHLATEDFAAKAGIKLTAVPYKGSGEVLSALLGNHIQFSYTGGALTHIRSGKVKGLAVTSAQRIAAAPELPTVREATGVDSVAEAWWAIVAPRGTPEPVVQRLNAAIGKVAAQPDLQAQFADWGFEFGASTPEQVTTRIQAETARWKQVIQVAGVPPID